MQNRAPIPREDRPALPDFAPVPRKYRHDGWTPARQKAFIEALADTGAVSRAARMVNMAQANCYTLRRAPGAEEFRRAWDAALDFGVQRLKDVAFERAIEGYLVPVFVGGKLAGYRRKTNDALLMFCLRHYGQDAQGRRTKVEYFSTRAEAGSADGGAVARASTTTVRTVISGDGRDAGGAERGDAAARALEDFAGVALDAQAEAAIAAALADCAARQRAADAVIEQGGMHAAAAQLDDPTAPFVRCDEADEPTWLTQEPVMPVEDVTLFAGDEALWAMTGECAPEVAVAEVCPAAGDAALPPVDTLLRALATEARETAASDRAAASERGTRRGGKRARRRGRAARPVAQARAGPA
ncbi:hypothetical protein EWE75_15485 [Sphingomonas populi]|uniref:Terminase n=1 Tax=Sphingomonas populi TaxID=2484750 RepID=A0A4Q6Y2M0_9SPHN|nr:hypothetical protein [Sphingomonas populi]RZF63579.1 hypothetical protein EWE75_15485 [Sphingomonas populi]